MTIMLTCGCLYPADRPTVSVGDIVKCAQHPGLQTITHVDRTTATVDKPGPEAPDGRRRA